MSNNWDKNHCKSPCPSEHWGRTEKRCFSRQNTCHTSAAGGAPERPEAAEGSAEEAAPSDEGEGPAAERAQPGRAGPQQTGGALPRAAEAQQDLKGSSRCRSQQLKRPHMWPFWVSGVVNICCSQQEVTSAGVSSTSVTSERATPPNHIVTSNAVKKKKTGNERALSMFVFPNGCWPESSSWMTGGDAAEVQRGRSEEKRDHHTLPGHAERDSGPNRGAQQPQHQAVPGEQRPGREAQGSHFQIRPARGGSDPIAHPTLAKLGGGLLVNIWSGCFAEPGEGLQAQRSEREAAGDQTHTSKPDSEGGRGEAPAGEGTGTGSFFTACLCF